MDNNTEKIKRRYDRAAKFFNLTENMMERGRMSKWREEIWALAKGKVLEVGVGTGKNMSFYRNDLEITAIDFSEKMLERARSRAKELYVRVDLVQMDAQKMDFQDESFDTVITTCVFCSVPDPIKGLQEIRRVCKKDGTIIMLEHVKSRHKLIGGLMELLNPVVVRIVGANINRDTVQNIRKAGISVDIEKDVMLDIVKHLRCSKNTAGA